MDPHRPEQSDIERTQAAEEVIASQDALIIIFEKIENLFKPLEEYAKVPTTEAVKDIVVKIMVKLLEIFAIMTNKINRGRASESVPDYMFPVVDRGPEMSHKSCFKKLCGRKAIERALSSLGRLTQKAVGIMKAAGEEENR